MSGLSTRFDPKGATRAASPCGPAAAPWVLAATILGSSMAFIDGTVVNVALPALQKDFRATLVGVQWVIEAYALLLAALLLVGGSLGDHFGRRRIFALGTAIFACASVWCGLAPNISQLIAARALQGSGGALLVPGSLAILTASFDEKDRGRAIGTWSGFTAITTAAGPVLGGWLIDNFSWRWAFFLNVPVAAAVLVLTWWKVPESRGQDNRGRLDWPGAVLATLGLAGIVYGLIESSDLGWRNPRVALSLALGAVVLTAFLVVERHAASPMLPLTLFRSRSFSGANLLTLFLYAALSGLFFFLPLNLIQVHGYTAASAGAAMLPFIVLMFALSRWSGGLVSRMGAKVPLVVGPSIAAAGFLLFALPGAGGSYWTTFFPAMIVLGLGMAVSVAPLTTTVMSSVSSGHAGVASGINNAVSRTAGLLAVAILSLVMLRVFERRLDARLGDLHVSPQVRAELHSQAARLAAAQVPAGATPQDRASGRRAIIDSFTAGFRCLMEIAGFLALVAAAAAWALIEGTKTAQARSD